LNQRGLFVFLDHHATPLSVGQAAEIHRREPFPATRPFKESAFPVTMPYLVSLSNLKKNDLQSVYNISLSKTPKIRYKLDFNKSLLAIKRTE